MEWYAELLVDVDVGVVWPCLALRLTFLNQLFGADIPVYGNFIHLRSAPGLRFFRRGVVV